MAAEKTSGIEVEAEKKQSGYTVQRHGASPYWQVLDAEGELVCLTVYKRGAKEVVRRLQN